MIFPTIDLDYRFSFEFWVRHERGSFDADFIEGLVEDQVAVSSANDQMTLDLKFRDVELSLNHSKGIHRFLLVKKEERNRIDLISNDSH